jgi:hypothetical protein
MKEVGLFCPRDHSEIKTQTPGSETVPRLGLGHFSLMGSAEHRGGSPWPEPGKKGLGQVLGSQVMVKSPLSAQGAGRVRKEGARATEACPPVMCQDRPTTQDYLGSGNLGETNQAPPFYLLLLFCTKILAKLTFGSFSCKE